MTAMLRLGLALFLALPAHDWIVTTAQAGTISPPVVNAQVFTDLPGVREPVPEFRQAPRTTCELVPIGGRERVGPLDRGFSRLAYACKSGDGPASLGMGPPVSVERQRRGLGW